MKNWFTSLQTTCATCRFGHYTCWKISITLFFLSLVRGMFLAVFQEERKSVSVLSLCGTKLRVKKKGKVRREKNCSYDLPYWWSSLLCWFLRIPCVGYALCTLVKKFFFLLIIINIGAICRLFLIRWSLEKKKKITTNDVCQLNHFTDGKIHFRDYRCNICREKCIQLNYHLQCSL